MARFGAKWSVDKGLLVIGYGSTLRRDDGVGPAVAAAVEELKLPGVRTAACTQLTPDLAEPLSGAGAVVFVDASVEPAVRVRLRRLDPADASQTQVLAHSTDPRALLALAQSLYGRAPRAWMLTIPVADLGFGDELTDAAKAGLRKAIRAVRALRRRLLSRGPT
jgi:hydrogenase maturation protease